MEYRIKYRIKYIIELLWECEFTEQGLVKIRKFVVDNVEHGNDEVIIQNYITGILNEIVCAYPYPWDALPARAALALRGGTMTFSPTIEAGDLRLVVGHVNYYDLKLNYFGDHFPGVGDLDSKSWSSMEAGHAELASAYRNNGKGSGIVTLNWEIEEVTA